MKLPSGLIAQPFTEALRQRPLTESRCQFAQLTASEDGKVRLWDALTGEEIGW